MTYNILWHIIFTCRWKEVTTIIVTRVTRDIIGDKSSICVFPTFTKANSRRRVYARFQRNDSQCRLATANYCTRWQTALVHRTRMMKVARDERNEGGPRVARESMPDPANANAKQRLTHFFRAYQRRTVSVRTFLPPSHASPSISARPSPSPASCFPLLLRGPIN